MKNENYRIDLAGFGVPDEHLSTINVPDLEITRRGEIWNKKTGKRFEENIIRLSGSTSYEEGYGPAIDRVIEKVESNVELVTIFSQCTYIELQIRIHLDETLAVPSISLTPEQMARLSAMRVHVDVDINWFLS